MSICSAVGVGELFAVGVSADCECGCVSVEGDGIVPGVPYDGQAGIVTCKRVKTKHKRVVPVYFIPQFAQNGIGLPF